MRVPRATYRLQLNAQFTFADAQKLLPYLEQLGVSDLYLSPINTAPPESTHNYDLWDYEEINPALGGETALIALSEAARQRGVGIIVDFVPNHMGIAGNGNKWWRDVLKRGPKSEFANFFDIQWQEEKGIPKLRLPVLGDFKQAVLDRGEIKITGDELVYFDKTFPIADGTLVAGDVAATLDRQFYRLMHWRYGTEQINYRRFFEVNTLAGVAVERENVFQRSHAKLLQLAREDKITGVRLDHIDGLADPNAYLKRLTAALGDRYLLVEKILAPDERVPDAWKICGTTGYDFLISLGEIWVDSRHEKRFTQIYEQFAAQKQSFAEMAIASKQDVLRRNFYSEFAALVRSACRLAAADPRFADLSQPAIEGALETFLAMTEVYRTYIECGKPLSNTDRAVIERIAARSEKYLAPYYKPAVEFLAHVWTNPCGSEEGDRFRTRLQQLSGPVMAKGIEDTAFYRYHRFIALNEVGGDPGRFGNSIESFHKRCVARVEHQPFSMLATSTHDTKFSEDVRARMAVLSEIPDEWESFAMKWRFDNARHRKTVNGREAPDANEEYRLLQALVGAFPYTEADTTFVERFQKFMLKSMREAKVNTTWHDPNLDWEKAVDDYIANVVHSPELRAFIDRVAPAGVINSLAQVLFKLTAPGVPDIYQGNELWDFSLVDPDNRRTVDYKLRAETLRQINDQPITKLLKHWQSGAIKMKVIRDTLKLRRENPDLFTIGKYTPLNVEGCLAFERSHNGSAIVIVVPRFVAHLRFPPIGDVWKDRVLDISGSLRNIFTGEQISGPAKLAEVFRSFPVALFKREGK